MKFCFGNKNTWYTFLTIDSRFFVLQILPPKTLQTNNANSLIDTILTTTTILNVNKIGVIQEVTKW